MDLRQVNHFLAKNPNLLSKALTSAANVGATFSPESLERIITDLTIKLKPELAVIEPIAIASKTHEFSRKTAKPIPGGAMGESATTPVTNSANARASVDLKIVRRKGKVTNFLKDISRELFDVATYEMQNHLGAHVLDLVNYMLYGNATANAYEFDGLDTLISTNRNIAETDTRGGKAITSLKTLDTMLDACIRKGGDAHKKVFEMSPEMLSAFTRFETTIRKNSDLRGSAFDLIEVPGGWRLATYRGVPIIQSTSTRPIEQMRPVVALAQEDTGVGSLSDGTYYIQVAPITPEGEQLASDEGSVVLSADTATQRIKITLSTYHTDANSVANVYAYKVYASSTSNDEKLVRVFPAYTYDAAGTPTLNNGLAGQDFYISSMTAGSEVPTAMQNDRPFVAVGGVNPEVIALWDLDPIQGLGKVPYTNTGGSAFNGLVTTEDLAKTDDFINFLVKSYLALCPSYEATSVWQRNLRVE